MKKNGQTNARVRYFSCISYLNECEIIAILKTWQNVKNYAYIYHDRDGNEPHFHIVLRLFNGSTKGAVQRRFKLDERNTLVEQLKSDTIYMYLKHQGFDDEEGKPKSQYSEKEIKSNDIQYWKKLDCEGFNENIRCIDMINDINNGISERELARIYGKDYILNRRKYRDFAIYYADEDKPIIDMEEYNRQLLKLEKLKYLINEFKQMNIEELELYENI